MMSREASMSSRAMATLAASRARRRSNTASSRDSDGVNKRSADRAKAISSARYRTPPVPSWMRAIKR